MAKILSFALLAICALQVTSASPLFGLESALKGIVEKVKDVAEDAVATVAHLPQALIGRNDDLTALEQTVGNANNGVNVRLAVGEDARENNVITSALKAAGSAISNIPKWLGFGDDDEESGDSNLGVNIAVAIQRDENIVVDAADATLLAREEAEKDLKEAIQASLNADVEATKEAAGKALAAGVEAVQNAKTAAKAAIAVGINIAQEAELKVAETVAAAKEEAKKALEIAEQAIAGEIRLAAENKEEKEAAVQATIQIAADVNQVFDDIFNNAEYESNKIKSAADHEILATKEISIEAQNNAEEALDTAQDATEEIDIAIDLKLERTGNTNENVRKALNQTIETEIIAVADLREEFDLGVTAAHEAIDSAKQLSDSAMDSTITEALEARETAKIKIQEDVATALNILTQETDEDESNAVHLNANLNIDNDSEVEAPKVVEDIADVISEAEEDLNAFVAGLDLGIAVEELGQATQEVAVDESNAVGLNANLNIDVDSKVEAPKVVEDIADVISEAEEDLNAFEAGLDLGIAVEELGQATQEVAVDRSNAVGLNANLNIDIDSEVEAPKVVEDIADVISEAEEDLNAFVGGLDLGIAVEELGQATQEVAVDKSNAVGLNANLNIDIDSEVEAPKVVEDIADVISEAEEDLNAFVAGLDLGIAVEELGQATQEVAVDESNAVGLNANLNIDVDSKVEAPKVAEGIADVAADVSDAVSVISEGEEVSDSLADAHSLALGVDSGVDSGVALKVNVGSDQSSENANSTSSEQPQITININVSDDDLNSKATLGTVEAIAKALQGLVSATDGATLEV